MVGAAWLDVGSLGLGLLAWILPLFAMVRQGRGDGLSLASISACAVSLYLQILHHGHLVEKGDWSALIDTTGAVILAATVLVVVTLALNGLALLLRKRKQAGEK